jgi:hypothetical protein
MKLKWAVLASTFVALLLVGNSQASAATYDLMLNSKGGQLEGTFSVSGSVPGAGPSLQQISSLSLTVGGTAYNFTSQPFTPAFATFSNGLLTSIEYLGSAAGFKLDLGTLGLSYIFADALSPGLSSVGTVSAVAAATTPLPPGLPLFMTGLAALLLLGRWHNRRGIETA